ncbi:hypothetical protein [Cohnella candidum]|uniref:Uncharacterized protein n=1 Tax=Cohnella candidum TaxID=2674991 RepID=A0A3G3JSX8_9BACL|nr:hypothetical protein [Cohnella candidum]AYQ71323.1 hypothetical protein EAV92_01190 [Cohnella candidum]
MLIEVLVGLSLGLVTILLARKNKREGWLYSAVVILLPLIYVAFALFDGDFNAAVNELLFGAPFIIGGLACLIFRVRMSFKIIGILWFAHGLFDVVHDQLFLNPGVPEWYPLFCAAVDIVIGAYLIGLQRPRESNNNCNLSKNRPIP